MADCGGTGCGPDFFGKNLVFILLLAWRVNGDCFSWDDFSLHICSFCLVKFSLGSIFLGWKGANNICKIFMMY